jgi:hypothetical protein
MAEVAEVLKVPLITVTRDWTTAKAWLYRGLTQGKSNGPGTLETSR